MRRLDDIDVVWSSQNEGVHAPLVPGGKGDPL